MKVNELERNKNSKAEILAVGIQSLERCILTYSSLQMENSCQVLSLQWDTADTDIMIPYFENAKLTNVLPLKPGAAHDVAMHARSFFHVLISAFLDLLLVFFFKSSPSSLTSLVLAGTVSRVGLLSKTWSPCS